MLKDRTLYIRKINETFLQVVAEDAIVASLSDFFSFFVPNYRFMKKFKMHMWDGRIRLFSKNTGEIYVGLLQHVKEFAKQHEYEIIYENGIDLDVEEEFSVQEAFDFAKSLNIHVKRQENNKDIYIPINAHDYQLDAFRHAVQTSRSLLLSPTSSGKSLFIYLLLRHYQPKIKGKILVIVPTVNLVMQMFTDFGEYSYADKWDIREQAHIIYSGKEKNSDKPIIISTWESIYKLGKDYFNQFEVVICDEAHLAKANSLTSIMNKCTKARYKFGTTGTLDGTKTHKLVLEGLFGRVYKVVSTAELIDRGILSKMDIQCLMLYYSDEICKKMKKSEYQQEITFLVENEARNKFIRNLVVSLTGNTLVLFNLVERHGKILYNLIKEKTGPDRKVFFISGKVEGEIREEFRQITERETDAIIVASYGTFSYGVNIRNLHNVIIASPVKSIIRLLQSIGRGLRKVDGKTLKFFDISDILQYKSWKNHTMKHFMIRMDIYNKEKFNWKLFKIRLKDSSG